MKEKQIKQSILAILMIAVLMVGTSAVSAGAATQKTYLDTTGYSSFNSTCPQNNCGPYNGKDIHGNQCDNAYEFFIQTYTKEYSNTEEVENEGYVSYTVSFLLNKKYNNFNFYLTSGKHIFNGGVKITIFGDDRHLYGYGVSESTNQVPASLDVSNVDILTFEISAEAVSSTAPTANWIILNNAYFTSEGTTPEPTTTVEPTTKPEPTTTVAPTTKPKPTTTVAPTTKPEPTTTVAPTTSKPVVIPTTAPATTATTVTSTTEKTTTKVNPTASTNATSKVSSPDTAGKTSTGLKGNVRNDNGTIKTGDVSIAVIVLLLISSLAAGTFAFYRRKIK